MPYRGCNGEFRLERLHHRSPSCVQAISKHDRAVLVGKSSASCCRYRRTTFPHRYEPHGCLDVQLPRSQRCVQSLCVCLIRQQRRSLALSITLFASSLHERLGLVEQL